MSSRIFTFYKVYIEIIDSTIPNTSHFNVSTGIGGLDAISYDLTANAIVDIYAGDFTAGGVDKNLGNVKCRNGFELVDIGNWGGLSAGSVA